MTGLLTKLPIHECASVNIKKVITR